MSASYILYFFSNCGQIAFENSSVKCPAYYNISQSYHTYPNHITQDNATELLNTLSNVTNGSYCTEILNKFLCHLIFPPCKQSNILVVDPKSCQNYVVDGICAVHVDAMIELLQNKNMTDTADNLRNCNSPLLEPDNTSSLSAITLPSMLSFS